MTEELKEIEKILDALDKLTPEARRYVIAKLQKKGLPEGDLLGFLADQQAKGIQDALGNQRGRRPFT